MSINKGMDLHINDFKEALYKTISDSQLPASIIVLQFKDILHNLELINTESIEREKKLYEEELNKQNKDV